MAKAKPKKYVSPYGVFKYAWLTKPNTKFKPDGEFQCTLVLSKEEAEPLIQAVNKLTDEVFNDVYNKAKKAVKDKLQKQYPYGPEYRKISEDEEVETGNIEFKFKQSHKVVSDGKEYIFTPDIFDRYNRIIPEDVIISTGSKGYISYTMRSYYIPATNIVGVTLDLKAAQVKELVQGGASAEAYGFAADEGEEETPPFDRDNSDGDF